jgi:hypothetical protein
MMQFDTADLAQMEADGSLVRVIIHEMGHVLGFGTIWDRLGLRQGAGTINPTFTGANAMREFGALQGLGTPLAVPVANTGGAGTRDAHWREQVFGNELLTGFLNTGVNPVSRMSIGHFEDLGYHVDYAAADPYTLPSALLLAIMGVGAELDDHGGRGIIRVPPQQVLPEDAYVDRCASGRRRPRPPAPARAAVLRSPAAAPAPRSPGARVRRRTGLAGAPRGGGRRRRS